MIFDHITQAQRYAVLNPRFERAFELLRSGTLAAQPTGEYRIDGDALFYIVAKDERTAETKPNSLLEAHRRYIDIQVALEGSFDIGWRSLKDCHRIAKPYSEDNDAILYEEASQHTMTLTSGDFAIFFPEDAHAPQPPLTVVKKVIFKVAI